MNKFFKMVVASATLPVLMLAGSGNAQTASASAVPANSPVTLSSDVKIERTERDAAGKDNVVLHDPKNVVVVPGDKVLFTLNVKNSGLVAASGFRATNPVPGPVTFVAVSEEWAEVSVDGGVTWGRLGTLTVNQAPKATDNEAIPARQADATDVTHVRWVFANTIAPSSQTSVSYRGVVK